jgi:hypothetical protein
MQSLVVAITSAEDLQVEAGQRLGKPQQDRQAAVATTDIKSMPRIGRYIIRNEADEAMVNRIIQQTLETLEKRGPSRETKPLTPFSPTFFSAAPFVHSFISPHIRGAPS